MMLPGRCWIHTGALDPEGYARSKVGGRMVSTHRTAYEALVGPIPAGMQLDHLCRNRACYNPSHLEPVTGGENIRRGHAARGTALTDHGRSMYTNRGCRCEVCQAANASYHAERRTRATSR